MPEPGERARGDAIGKNPTSYYVWAECPGCETGRWVNPKPSYQASKNRVRLCKTHALKVNRFNFRLPGSSGAEGYALKGRATD